MDAPARDRPSLADELAAYRAHDEREAAMVARMRAFLAEHDDAFERSQTVGHVTASAWVLDDSRTRVLLTHHRKLDRWLQLGGHADGERDARAVALREAAEESGLTSLRPLSEGIYDVDVHEIPARPGEPAHAHYDVRFAFVAPPGAEPVCSEESHAVAWIPLAELGRYGADASVERLAAKTGALSHERRKAMGVRST